MKNAILMRLQYLLFFTFLKSGLIFGQGEMPESEMDSILTYRYHIKFESLLYDDAQVAHKYLDSLSILSKTSRFLKAKFYYHQDLGALNFVEHNLEKSHIHYQKAYALAIEGNWKKEAILAKIWLANLDYFKGDFIYAKSKYREILAESTKIEFVDGIANAFFGLADLQDNKKSALEYLIKVDSVYQYHDTVSPILANTYDFIGRIYLETFRNKALAKEYFLKALEISKQTNYSYGIDYVTNELMELDFNNREYQNLSDYLHELLSQNTLQKDTIAMARNLFQLGKLEMNFDRLSLAEPHLQAALGYFMLLGDITSQDNSHLLLANTAIKKKNFTGAQRYLDQISAVQITLKNSLFIEKMYKTQIQILTLKQDYQLALEQQQKLDSLKSILTDQKNDELFLEMERQFQTNKKVQEIALLTSRNQLAQQQKTNQRDLFLSIIIVILLVAFSFYALYRNRQRINRKLEELDAFKSQFYVNISHEFRTPLTLLLGPIEKQLDETGISLEKRSELNLMKRNTQRLLNLVNQLLDLSRLESGHLKLHVSEGNLAELLYALSRSFAYQASQKNIDFNVNIDSIGQVWYDKDIMEKVVTNLLSNGFKYTPEYGEVVFRATILDDRLILFIENEGQPLPKSKIDKLFDRFYQADEYSEGVGIGLAYVKELVTLSHGSISVEQLSDKKLQFKVSMPLKKEQFRNDELSKHPYETNSIVALDADEFFEKESFTDDDLPILLLVEDSSDIRKFIKSSFKDNYLIIEADNGKQGLDKAIEFIPDLIISDVMMPVMDGFELVSILKKDERTCHIPMILLTAKADEMDEFMGLNTGADDYIVKPFSMKLLRTRVKNLLDTRDKLRQRYSQELVLKPKNVVVTNLDVLFFEKVKTILDVKLTESSFSIEDFSKAIGMSRMQLHRKLKALTGISATEFVREQRLKLAATLIGQSDINIAEIGYMVGFNDHSYFAKCFKQTYGCSPSEYKPSKNL